MQVFLVELLMITRLRSDLCNSNKKEALNDGYGVSRDCRINYSIVGHMQKRYYRQFRPWITGWLSAQKVSTLTSNVTPQSWGKYLRLLSFSKILSGCQSGLNQNQNESLNLVVSKPCLKTLCCGMPWYRIVICDAVYQFHDGAQERYRLSKILKLTFVDSTKWDHSRE